MEKAFCLLIKNTFVILLIAMKNLFLILLCLVVFITCSYGQNNSSEIKDAYDKYGSGDYKSAIALFSEMDAQKNNPYNT